MLAGDWEFIATLVHEADGAVITRAAPGRRVGQLPPITPGRCDHCGTSRRRDMQMGRSCLQPFLGMRPSGLWALDFQLPGDITTGGGGGGASRADLRVPVRHILATALAVSDHGRTYVSRTEEMHHERLTSTASQVTRALFQRPGRDHDLAAWQRKIEAQTTEILTERDAVDAANAPAARPRHPPPTCPPSSTS